METMMETQRMEYERFTNQLLDKQQECFKQMHVEDMKKMEDKMREYNLSMENIIRQKDAKISELENELQKKQTLKSKETDVQDPTPDDWLGKSPGPEVMQGKTMAMIRQTPMTAQMETPNGDWEELLEETVEDWVNHVSKTGRQAPEE